MALERRKASKLQAEAEGETGPGGTEQPSSVSPDADQGVVPAEQNFTPALSTWADEPSIDNPPFEENTGTDSMSSAIFSALSRVDFTRCRSGYGVRACLFAGCACTSSSSALSLAISGEVLVGFYYGQVCSWAKSRLPAHGVLSCLDEKAAE